jgi:hypothetical protein
MEPAGEMTGSKLLKTWWPGTELNRRRQPFQGCALPPELPGHAAPLHGPDACELWATPDLPELPVIAGSQECGSASNSHDYNNQAGFPQRNEPRLAITQPVAFKLKRFPAGVGLPEPRELPSSRKSYKTLVNLGDSSPFFNRDILREGKIPQCGGLPLARAQHPVQKTGECMPFGVVRTTHRKIIQVKELIG